jgi:5-methylcytosine-specific restriction endonuclease McrA
MPFSPRQDYNIIPGLVRLKDFDDFPEAYITRPPYQRKTVWEEKRKQALMDSLLRRYYVPKLVLRVVRLSDERAVDEVIDGQQRINTVQEFFANKFKLPETLRELSSDMAGKTYEQLPVEIKQYVSKLELAVDRITNIENPKDPSHQRVATDIFWRLQQGESLNQMEIAHARLSSKVRNFLVKYADDITFDYQRYVPIDRNPNKHPFFQIISQDNKRMQHLGLLARMLLIERHGGPTDVRDKVIIDLIDDTQTPDGIGDDSFENDISAKNVLSVLSLYHDLFKGDPMLTDGGTIKELSREYFMLSFFGLLRHVRKAYAINDDVKKHLRSFFDVFYQRWRNVTLDDRDMAQFAENRQQSSYDLRERDLVLRQLFFEYLKEANYEMVAKDTRRAFNEAERIAIYRSAKGLCQACKSEGKSDEEATVPWGEYEADHLMPHSQGGPTSLDNAQLLCQRHNRSKGATIATAPSTEPRRAAN